MATFSTTLTPRQLSLPGKILPPALPLIISSPDNWNPVTNELETPKLAPPVQGLKLVDEAVELLKSIDKPLAVLSICGPYRSGKSYFISRVLGSSGAFKLGHSMQACTRGIWMATTVLECDQFSTIVLDSEGIDAVGVSETFTMSLLTITTLLSSYLIYNSKKVPQKNDLSKIKCFTDLANIFWAQSAKDKQVKEFFPHFLWLLRDVALKMTDVEGKIIEPTEFLYTKILKTESGECTELGKALSCLYPSVECATLPIPSTKRNVLHDIVEQQHMLKPAFNAAIQNVILKIMCKLTPKKAILNGVSFVSLAYEYIEALNRPGAVPDIDKGWQAIIILEVKKYSDKLLKEYRTEMESVLKGNFPMEEICLLQIHREILNQKKSCLQEEIVRIYPIYSCAENIAPLDNELEKQIVQWGDEDKSEVVGGALLEFTTENYSKSKEQCEKVFGDLLKKNDVEKRVTKAIINSEPLKLNQEFDALLSEYNNMAIGPAASDALERGLEELKQLEDVVQMIPGKPQMVEIVGRDAHRVKLTWETPIHNPTAVEFYIISSKAGGGEWEEIKRTEKTNALITGLKPRTKYEFEVKASNALLTSIENEAKCTTKPSDTYMAYKGATICSYNLPAFSGLCTTAINPFIRHPFIGMSKLKKKLVVGTVLPLSILLSPITAPLGAVLVVTLNHQLGTGDLSED